MIPGELFAADGEIEFSQGRERLTVTVANTGDRPVQVGSHYHFYETNSALEFPRDKTRGFRLDITPGTAVRFERCVVSIFGSSPTTATDSIWRGGSTWRARRSLPAGMPARKLSSRVAVYVDLVR